MNSCRVWLGLILILFFLQACSSQRTANDTTSQPGNQSSAARAGSTGIVKSVYTAKDNGKGAPGERSDTFGPADRIIHCVVELNEAQPGSRILFSWWVLEAEGVQNEKIEDFEYTIKQQDQMVHGHLTVPEDFPPGKYQVKVYVNGNLAETVAFSVN